MPREKVDDDDEDDEFEAADGGEEDDNVESGGPVEARPRGLVGASSDGREIGGGRS